MTMQQITINSVKARIEAEVKKELPDWKAIKQLAENGEMEQNQYHLAYNTSGEIVKCPNFEF